MRAIILAAGRGSRLQQAADRPLPKCLFRFGGRSLLERHLGLLEAAGVSEVSLALGFEHEVIEEELARLGRGSRVEVVLNPRYELGSMLTVHAAAAPLTRGGDVLLMDADVLYHERIMAALTAGRGPVNRVLIDRDFEAGEEPVKVCVRAGVPVELRKKIEPGLEYDMIGESVGFFRFDERAARRFAAIVEDHVVGGRAHLPHEEAVRDLLLERSQRVEVCDVTGAPWIEIDFPEDVARATDEVLPQLEVGI